mmetsp:Transcript_20567/g.44443  ORF Transcript_20567/g.44443 Transcript_20567/m.44443 type:complete len:247 (+) Transcript_20567:482-1222(+)
MVGVRDAEPAFPLEDDRTAMELRRKCANIPSPAPTSKTTVSPSTAFALSSRYVARASMYSLVQNSYKPASSQTTLNGPHDDTCPPASSRISSSDKDDTSVSGFISGNNTAEPGMGTTRPPKFDTISLIRSLTASEFFSFVQCFILNALMSVDADGGGDEEIEIDASFGAALLLLLVAAAAAMGNTDDKSPYFGMESAIRTSSPYLAAKYSIRAHFTNRVLKYHRTTSPHCSFGTNAGRRYVCSACS